MSQRIQLGSVGFLGEVFPFALQKQTPPSLQTGPAIQRSGRQGVVSLVLDDYSKGFLPMSGVQRWDQSKGRVYYNQGVMLHMPGLACLAYKSTSVTNLQIAGPSSIDISGYRAANKRVHAIMSSLGSASGGRFYAFVGPNLYKDTSTSSAVLIPSATADNISDNVTATWAGRANATDYLIIGTDGQTSDTRGTTDPTQDSVTWQEIFTHPSTDRTEAGWYFPQWDYNALIHGGSAYGFPGGTAALPYTTSTASPIVYTETKDVTNADATITTYGPYYFRTIHQDEASTTITNLENILTDDSSYATISTNDDFAMRFTVYDPALDQELPASIVPTGVSTKIIGKQSANNVDGYVSSVSIGAGGVAKTQTLAAGTEFNKNGVDTDAEFEFGGSQDRWGANLTNAAVRAANFSISWIIDYANTIQTLSVDHVSVKIYGVLTGTQVMFGKGGHGIGPNPASATQRLFLAPSRAESAAVTVEREPWLLDFAFDSEGNRLTCSPTKVAAGMAHTEDACHHQGGYAIAGGSAPGPAEIVKIIDSNGITRSLGFPQVHGSTAVRVTSLFSANTALMAWVCNADSTDAQLWVFIDGAWNAYGALFSKTLGGAMSTTPLAYAERTMGTTNKNIYNFYPSSTNTAYIRQFVPTDVLTDPRLTNTTQARQDGPLYFQGVMIDIMPEEALKAFTGMEMQTQYVDDNTAYGSVNWKMDVLTASGTSATAVTTSAINEDFNATNETYRLRAFSSSNDPGIAFRAAQPKCTLDHEAGSAESPNGLPAIFYISADWKPLQRFSVRLDVTGQTEGPVALAKRIRDMFVTKNVQRFSGEGQQMPVKLDIERGGYDFLFKNTTQGLTPPTWDDLARPPEIFLMQTEGAIA